MNFPPILATVVLLGTLAAPALAQSNDGKVTMKSSPGKATAARTRSVTATVTEIDAAKRTLTIKSPKGETHSLKVGPDVRNLAQVKVGDSIVVRYQEALSLTLKKDGKPIGPATGAVAAARAASGERPAAGVVAEVEVTANVIAVDPKQQIVTLKGPEQTVELLVKDPEQFKLIKVGDQIQAVYTQALAVSVEPASVPKK